jgi:hypothetical protein
LLISPVDRASFIRQYPTFKPSVAKSASLGYLHEMDHRVIPAAIAFSGENRDLKIGLIVAFVLAVGTGMRFTSRMRRRAQESGFSAWDPRSTMAGLGWIEVLAFACCWIVGVGALLWLKNLQ